MGAPIRIGLQGKYPAYFETFVLQQIEDLQRLTNHPIELYYSPTLQREKRPPPGFDRKKTNVILFYLPRDKISGAVARLFRQRPRAGCGYRQVVHLFCEVLYAPRRDRAAIAVFPDHHPKNFMRACVVEN